MNDWIDASMYPFRPHYFPTPAGRMHYVDEGRGPVVLLVHGTPTWSFLFRDLIRDLSRDHRVLAVDHLGFGLSDKPASAPYEPQDHARRLGALCDALELDDVTLLVHDFGGPIGLAWALDHPERIHAPVLMNTWMWSLEGTSAARVGRLFSGIPGRLLYTRLNFSPRILLPAGFADRSRLTDEVHRHYLAPFPEPGARRAPWVLARALAASSDWYAELWTRRERLEGARTLLLWGMKDRFFGPDVLDRWRDALPDARVHEFPEAGHFVPEEVDGAVIGDRIRAHLRESPASLPQRRADAGRRGGGKPHPG